MYRERERGREEGRWKGSECLEARSSNERSYRFPRNVIIYIFPIYIRNPGQTQVNSFYELDRGARARVVFAHIQRVPKGTHIYIQWSRDIALKT